MLDIFTSLSLVVSGIFPQYRMKMVNASMNQQNPDKFLKTGRRNAKLQMANIWDIFYDALKNYTQNSDVNQAAAIAFYAILSIIPLFLLTLLAASQIFGSHPDIQKDIAESIKGIHPFFSEDLLSNLVQVKEKSRILSGMGIVSLIWLSAMIFGALEKSLNIIFRARTLRNFIGSKIMAFAMIPMGWFIGATSIVISYISNILEKQTFLAKVGIPSNIQVFISRHFLAYLLVVAFVTLLYRVVPRVKVTLGGAFGGALIFATLLELAKYFFAWYMAKHALYDVIFGSMQAVVILVIWVFYVSIILLFCAELISSYERRDLILLEEAFLKPKSKVMKTDERLFQKFGRLYPKDSYLFHEGGTGREMFYILDGEIRVEKKAGHVSKVLAEIGAGSYLGEMAALIDSPRTASAYAARDSHVAVIGGDILRDVLRESEGVSLFMLREFSNRIKHTNDDLERVTQECIKFFIVLYFLKEWPVATGRNYLGELAGLTGKTTEEIEDILKWLCKKGILFMQDGRVTKFSREQVWNLLDDKIK